MPFFAVVLSLATPSAQRVPEVDAVITRAGEYVAQFVERFSNVVAEEHYVQDAVGSAPPVALRGRGELTPTLRSQHLALKADFLLVTIGPTEVLPFRDVFEVDGEAIRDREQRLAKLFLQPSETALARATAITNESARYNIGAMQRTINNPILALVFLQRETQGRFRFSLDTRDSEAGENVWIVKFEETARPTLVRGINGGDIPSEGRFWIDTESGRVARSELALTAQGVRARITTSFTLDERFQIDVPVEMREEYVLDRSQVSATATYGRFRRFDVKADESFEAPEAPASEPR